MSWYDAIGKAADAIEALKSAELNQLLANVRMEGAKLAEENARQREELIALREAARLRGTMVFRDDTYWQDVAGGAAHGPYCPKCWPADSKAVRMVRRGSRGMICPVCDTYIEPQGLRNYGDDDFGSPRRPIRDEQV
jgi:hypothetical protein